MKKTLISAATLSLVTLLGSNALMAADTTAPVASNPPAAEKKADEGKLEKKAVKKQVKKEHKEEKKAEEHTK